MTSVTSFPVDSVLRFTMGRSVMKRIRIAVSLLLVVALFTGCDRAKNEVLPDGTKVFGERILKDGTKRIEQVEFPSGQKQLDKTILPDGTEKDACDEFPNGEKRFEVTVFRDGTQKVGRIEFPDGEKHFDVTILPDKTEKDARIEHPSGQKFFDVTVLADGTVKKGLVEFPDGAKQFDVTTTPDHIQKVWRLQLPNGENLFDVTTFPDGKQKVGRIELPIQQNARDRAVPTVSKSDFSPKPTQVAMHSASDGEAIAYLDFYVKARTGLPIGKRYHFVADIGSEPLCLHPTGYLDHATFDTQHILCGVVPAFDDPAEHKALLRAGEFPDAKVVASMGADGVVRIHKVLR
jgi:hypothetical protein